MTPAELESLRPENVRGKGNRDLLEVEPAKNLSIGHLFERKSVARPLHVAAELLGWGIGKASVQDALAFVKDFRFVDVGKLLSTHEVLA